MGLINKVVSEHKLHVAASDMAKLIAAHSPITVKMAKEALRHSLESTLQQSLDYETHLMTFCFSTRDHYEEITSFLDKRKPEFKGI